MTEPEVSLRLAIYYLKNHLTSRDVMVSIDGAHIKTGNTVHFDIEGFLKENLCVKMDGDFGRWQGVWHLEGQKTNMILNAVPGNGDVQVVLPDGKTLFVESKKGGRGKSSQEYRLMREAIGQLMTSRFVSESTIPAVAVPYAKKSLELAERWSKLEQIQRAGIRFLLVQEDGNILAVQE